MKKSFWVLILSILFSNIISSGVYASEVKDLYHYYICSKIYEVKEDKKNKLFIIPADKKKYAVKIVYKSDGRLINLNDKVIQYKNGRISKIGNDYISYLNGKLYTIGGKKVETENLYVVKIGNLTPHEYFIGNDFTMDDVFKNSNGLPEANITLSADGKDFGGFFTDFIIPFDGQEIFDGSKDLETQMPEIEKSKEKKKDKDQLNEYFQTKNNGKAISFGNETISYSDGRIESIGKKRVYYSDGQIYKIGDDRVYYSDGKVYKIGDKTVYYSDGKIYKIGDDKVYYSNGQIYKIGDKTVRYTY